MKAGVESYYYVTIIFNFGNRRKRDAYDDVAEYKSGLGGGKTMQWIDGSEIDIKQYTGESLCEKMSLEMWSSCLFYNRI